MDSWSPISNTIRIALLLSKKYIFVLLWISPYLLNAQDSNPYSNIIPPNPDAASLAKYADFPVDLSSGIPQISIPLWNIKCGDINVPISLSYHASGIPVAETPSYVGLGWTLNAGGAISRTIRGVADDGMHQQINATSSEIEGILTWYPNYAIYPNYPNSSEDYANPPKYREAAAGKRDLEPDMFYYNFCNSAGKFVFDFNGTPHLIPRKNILIEKEQKSDPPKRIIKWTITTDDGLKYYFEEVETTVQDTKTEAWVPNGANLKASIISNSLITSEHHSAWFLTKIEMPNSAQSVVFEYDEISQENTCPVSETYKVFSSSSGGTPLHSGKNIYEETQTKSTITGKRLRKIIAPDQTVEFIPGAYRHDLKGDKVLDEVVITNKEGEIIKQFKLSYNYFSSNGTTFGAADPNSVLRTDLRLSLKSVDEVDKPGNRLPPYTFEYENSVTLPDRFTSKAQDHWGYYNGEDENTSLIPYLNAIRDASEDAMKAGSLVKINYPTGGYTQFNYEANNISTNVASMTGSGLRIKEKIDYDPVSKKSLFKQYDYNSSGYIGYTPAYSFATSTENTSYINHTSSSNSALNNGGEGIIGYGKVTVIEGNDEIGINGKTENDYTILQSTSHYPIDHNNYTDKVILNFSMPISNIFPFAPVISGAWGCGLLKSQRIYKFKNNSYYKIKEIQNTYKNDYWGAPNIYNSETDVLAAKVGVISTCSDCFGRDEFGTTKAAVQFYFIPSRNINLIKTIETDYDDAEIPITSKVTEIEYDNFSPHIYPSKTTHTLSDGNKLVEQTLYPQDYTNVGNDFIGLMKTNHIINKPIENINYKIEDSNTLITSGGIFTYKVGDNLGKPDKVFTLQAPISKSDFKLSNKTTTNALSYSEGSNTSFSLGGIDSKYTSEPAITYDVFDNKGNLLQYHKEKDIYTTYIWGYNGQYPIAKIENATYSEVESALAGYKIGNGIPYTPYLDALENGMYLENGSYKILNDAGVRLLLGPLRTELPNALVTTYTYKSLVGMTSVTDFNGKTTYYEYDEVGRLKYIKDNNSSILKSYDYHYKE